MSIDRVEQYGGGGVGLLDPLQGLSVRPGDHGAQLGTESRRFLAFLVVGGTSALINLATLTILSVIAHWPYLPAALIATEVGIFESFLLNDRLTFRGLAADAGGLVRRCLRFYAAGGGRRPTPGSRWARSWRPP